MANLDGKDVIKPVPFDAHEQTVRGTHVATAADSPDLDPEKVQKYPLAVDHVDHPSGVGQEPVVVASPEEHAAYNEAQAAEAE